MFVKVTTLFITNLQILKELRGFYLAGVWLWRISGGDKITAPLCSTSKNNVEQSKTC